MINDPAAEALADPGKVIMSIIQDTIAMHQRLTGGQPDLEPNVVRLPLPVLALLYWHFRNRRDEMLLGVPFDEFVQMCQEGQEIYGLRTQVSNNFAVVREQKPEGES